MDIIQSAGGIIYFIDKNNEPRFLLIKRHAISGKIERVAPKGKLQGKEKAQDAAVREASEETGIPINQLRVKDKVGVTSLRNPENRKGQINKDVTYFLMEYLGSPDDVNIDQVEGYVGIHKWANLEDVLGLIYYQDIRELIRKAHNMIRDKAKKQNIKKEFLKKLDI